MKDISKPLTGDIISLNNEMTRLETANMKIQFSYNHNSYSIDTDVVVYQTKNNKTTEYIDDKNIIYKNNNYYIIPSNIDSYILYYKYDERPWYGNNDETEATWYVLNFGLYKTLEAAKEKINEYSNILYICPYSDSETISKCNYKEYRYANDLIIDVLNNNDLYIDSYDQISLDHGDIKVEKNNNTFTIRFESGLYHNFEEYTNFKLNDSDFYLKDRSIIHNGKNIKIDIYVGLNYKIEETEKNIISEFKKTFSK